MKIVSQLNADGIFVGSAIADESPLETGVFLLPAGAVDVAPIDVPQGKRAKWTGDSFVFEDVPVDFVADQEIPKPLTPDEIIEAKKREVRRLREQVLDRLSGIAGRASRKGDTALAAACDIASEALLDITKDLPSEPDAVELMLFSRYQVIAFNATQAAPSLANAFAQVDA